MKLIKETKNDDGTVTLDLELTDEEDKQVKELAERYQCTENEAIERAVQWYLKQQQNVMDGEDEQNSTDKEVE